MSRISLCLVTRLLLCVVAVPSLAIGVAVGEDWSQWRGPDRANRSVETGLFDSWGDDGPPLAWVAEGLGEGYASVSVVGPRAYTTGNLSDGQSVIAIDTTDGKVAWTQKIHDGIPQHSYPGSRSTPTIDDDRLYVVSSHGAIACLRTRDGSIVWSRDFTDWDGRLMSGWGFSESPLIDGERVICTPGGSQGMVVALDKMTGNDIWACPWSASSDDQDGKSLKDGAGYSSVVISNGGGVKQYVQMVGRGVMGVRADDGKLLWTFSGTANPVANIATSIVDGDLVFTSSAYGTGSALLKLNGIGDTVEMTEVYFLGPNQLQNKHGGMTLIDGYIYCGHGNGEGKPVCIKMETGETAWGPERAKGRGESSVVYADGHLVFRRDDGTVLLIAATPEEMRIVNSFKPKIQDGKSWAHPVISGGKLYLREQDKLMCFQLK